MVCTCALMVLHTAFTALWPPTPAAGVPVAADGFHKGRPLFGKDVEHDVFSHHSVREDEMPDRYRFHLVMRDFTRRDGGAR